MAHIFRDIVGSLFLPPAFYDGHAQGFRRAEQSVHMGFRIAELAPGGTIDAYIHSFEKGIFITEGEVELNRNGELFALGHHDFALIPIGTPILSAMSRPIQCASSKNARRAPRRLTSGRTASLPRRWNGPGRGQGRPRHRAAQAHGRPFRPQPAAPEHRVDKHMCGWSKKLLIDKVLGAHQFDMFIIEFDEGGQTSTHDHNFEEAYLVLEGEVTFTAAGKEYVLTPGTIAWSGVGAPHGFYMNRGMPCRWLEVMSPQPPTQFGNRRMANWDEFRATLEG